MGIIDRGRLRFEGPKAALAASSRQLICAGEAAAAVALPAAALGHGVQILDDRTDGGWRKVVLRANDPALLASLDAGVPDPWQLQDPSLEDIFVALVRSPMSY